MRYSKHIHIILAGLTSVILLVMTYVAIYLIEAEDRENVSQHILTRLQATSDTIDLWVQDNKNEIGLLAKDPSLVLSVHNSLHDKTHQDQPDVLARKLIQSVYQRRGYLGYLVINSDRVVIDDMTHQIHGGRILDKDALAAVSRAFNQETTFSKPHTLKQSLRMPEDLFRRVHWCRQCMPQ